MHKEDRAIQNSNDSVSSAAFMHRNFRLFWVGQFVSLVGTQMQAVTINWHVYLLTKSAFALGLVGLARFIPLVLCSLIGGAVADAYDRRRTMLVAQTVMMAVAAFLAIESSLNLKSALPIYILTAISSAASAFDTPARQSLVPALVPTAQLSSAVSFVSVAFQSATIAGPLLAGLLLASHGPALIYILNALSFLAVITSLMAINVNRGHRSGSTHKPSFGSIAEGLKFVRRTPVIVQTMMIDFVATVTASVTGLLPIFAVEVLRVGPRGLGTLAAAPAAGAIVSGLVIAKYGFGRRPGVMMLSAVAIYGLATLAFGISRAFFISLMLLAIMGATDIISTVIRQTTRQLMTPDRLRGRMTSINMIFFNGGPRLGELQAGFVAAVLGAPLAVMLGGVTCVSAVIMIAFRARNLLALPALSDRSLQKLGTIVGGQDAGLGSN
ncbi:MAG: hypothetical protein QOE96_3770 [Blastocatellia bacterium]|jgi:MFS family permease|nr:hypothetical protein [Blastocatellia bacterium]